MEMAGNRSGFQCLKWQTNMSVMRNCMAEKRQELARAFKGARNRSYYDEITAFQFKCSDSSHVLASLV